MSLFNKIQLRRPSRNKFNLSHERKLSLKMGNLVPIMCQEVVPGDKFRVNTQVLMRMAPMLAPIMHRVNVKVDYFFVPNRLIWSEWEDFITGGVDGTLAPVAPYFEMSDLQAQGVTVPSSLLDYMGLPIVDAFPDVDTNISALPPRAYSLIYNEYYRDPNLEVPLDISKASGQMDNSQILQTCLVRKRAWEKDYFTSALPWAQRGGDVSLPIDGLTATNTVNYKSQSNVLTNTGNPMTGNRTLGALDGTDDLILSSDTGSPPTGGVAGRIENIESIDTDISGTSVTVNELRRSVRLQEWLEKNARAGYRYIEQIFSHFGVKSSDARLQRPEYLGGSSNPMQVSEVLSTVQQVNPSTGDPVGNPQGDMTGRGIAMAGNNGFKRFFEEHGFVIGILSVLPRTAYQQGIPKMFTRTDKLDYYWPEFAQLGEQEVKLKELYYTGASLSTPEATFGYQSRYAEYKFMSSTVHGAFRDTLAFWHMGRIFSSAPQLNEDFVKSDPTNRVFAVQDGTDELWCQLYNQVDALRPMPYFGTPTI